MYSSGFLTDPSDICRAIHQCDTIGFDLVGRKVTEGVSKFIDARVVNK